NKTDAYLPNEAVEGSTCCHTMFLFACTDGAVGPGKAYQDLSKMTGGLRFPICQYDSFDAVFKAVAGGVVAGAKVACGCARAAAASAGQAGVGWAASARSDGGRARARAQSMWPKLRWAGVTDRDSSSWACMRAAIGTAAWRRAMRRRPGWRRSATSSFLLKRE